MEAYVARVSPVMTGADSGRSEKASGADVSKLSKLATFPAGLSLAYGNEAFSYINNPRS